MFINTNSLPLSTGILESKKHLSKSVNLVIKSVTETKMGNSLVKVDKNTYAGIISLEEIEKGNKNEITVEIEWLDNEEDTDQDIEIGEHENFSYKIPISIHVCQYLGEELNTYIEN